MQILMGSTVGLYVGYALWLWIDFKTRPELYAMMSAPWYTGLLVHGVFAAAALLIELVVWLLVRRK